MILYGARPIQEYLGNPHWVTIKNWVDKLGCPVKLGCRRMPTELAGLPTTQPMAETDDLDRWLKYLVYNVQTFRVLQIAKLNGRVPTRPGNMGLKGKRGAITWRISKVVAQMGYELALMVMDLPTGRDADGKEICPICGIPVRHYGKGRCFWTIARRLVATVEGRRLVGTGNTLP